MKIGKYPVKHTYKIARIVSDVLSLGIALLIFSATLRFFPLYESTLNLIGQENLAELVANYSYSLTYRHYFAWIFPALTVGVFAAYLILTLKNHKFQKYRITKQNAQSVYDWYAFAVSLCKIPLLMGTFDAMYIYHKRMLFEKISVFSVQIILDIIIVAIIIRFTIHRIKNITAVRASESDSEAIRVKAKTADDDKE